MDKFDNQFAHIIPDIPAKPWRKTDMPKHILIIRLQAIGDMVATLSYIQYFKRSLPNTVKIDFLILEEVAVIPQSIELFNNVYALAGGRSFKKQLLHAAILLPKLLLQRYDVIIDMQNNKLSRMIRKVLSPEAWSAFDRFSPMPGGERYRLTIQAAGLGPNYADSNIILKPVPGTTELLKKNGWDGKSKLVIINPVGAFETRNWPLINYFEFMKLWLQQWPDTQFLIMGVGAIADKAVFLKIIMGDHLINLSNKTNLAQAFSIVHKAKFVLSEDSGLMHMAWTLGVPTLALFGGTRSDWARPLGPHTDFVDSSDLSCGNCMLQTCIHGDNRCITRFIPETIFTRATALLNSLIQEELV